MHSLRALSGAEGSVIAYVFTLRAVIGGVKDIATPTQPE
jgi:hypothetical protein